LYATVTNVKHATNIGSPLLHSKAGLRLLTGLQRGKFILCKIYTFQFFFYFWLRLQKELLAATLSKTFLSFPALLINAVYFICK